MKIQRCIAVILVLLAAQSVLRGQEVEKPRPPSLDGARLDDLRARGYEALYNLDYEEARRLFQEMSRLFPEHPAGPQCLAATLWLDELNRARHLQASLYSAEAFSARADAKPDPKTLEQFRRWTREAKALAEARLRRDERDTEALYFLGATEGLKSVFAAASERRFLDALRDGSAAAGLHRRVLKLDPDFRDAELTIGMHDYIVGSLPLPLKLLANVGGVRGSKKRGLQTLERVAKEGRWARDTARLLLIDIYKREKRWAEAAALALEMSARFPRNHLFQLQAADALVAQAAGLRRAKGAKPSSGSAEEREAFGIFEKLLDGRGGGARWHAAAPLIHFRYGEALLAAGRPESAAKEFLAASKGGDASAPALATTARLRAAQAFDLAGKRSEALAEYRAVLERTNVHKSHEEARRGLREPHRQSSQANDRK